MKSKTYVKGDKELRAALRKLQEVGNGAKLVPAVDAGLLVIQNEIVEKAPHKTGNYARSWHLGEADVKAHGAYNTTGTDVVYGPRLEFGFADTDALGRTYHQTARPHVRPAFSNKRADALTEVKNAVLELVAQAI